MLAGAKVRRRVGLVSVVSVVASLLVFCPAAFALSSIYVTNEGSSTVSQYTVVAAGGRLSPKTPATVAAGPGPIAVALSPDGTSAYEADYYGAVSQYTVAADGTLSPKTPAIVATGNCSSPWAIALSANGTRAYVVCYANNLLFEYKVAANGTLSPLGSIGAGANPDAIALSANGTSAYVTNQGYSSVSQYTVAANGRLSYNGQFATGGGPSGVALSADGKSAYVTNRFSNTVSQYTVAANGTLSPKTPATVATGDQPVPVVLSPDGRSAYVANYDGGVSQYTVAADGTLSPKTPATVAAGSGPSGITLSADGTSAYVTNRNDNTVSQYTVAADGTLSPKTPATVAAGNSPWGIAATPRLRPAITSVAPSSGPVGGSQVVTITGINFTGATAVKFGTSAATRVVVVSSKKITVKTPAHAAGTVNVWVVTPSGVSAPAAAGKYTYAGAPTITSVSPSSGPVGGSQAVTITGTKFTGARAVKFGTSAATSVVVVSSTKITVKTPAHAAGTVNVQVVTPSGSSPLVAADEYTYQDASTITSVAPSSGPVGGW